MSERMSDEELASIERIWTASLTARKEEPPPEHALDMFAFSESGEWPLENAWVAALDAAHTHVPKLITEVKRLRALEQPVLFVKSPGVAEWAKTIRLVDEHAQVLELQTFAPVPKWASEPSCTGWFWHRAPGVPPYPVHVTVSAAGDEAWTGEFAGPIEPPGDSE